MQAVRLSPDKRHEIVEVPEPRPGADEVLVRPAYCGICGTDLHAADFALFRPGVIVGHEFSGEIVEVGRHVEGWSVGQRVVINPNGHVCGQCSACRSGRFNQCPVATQERPAGVVVPGGIAELVALHPAYLNAIPDALDLRRAAWTEPLAVALRTVRTSPIRVGDTAVVIGGGPIGQLVIQLLARSGITAITLIEASPFRAATGIASGAAEALLPAEAEARLAERTLAPAACVFECSGHASALQTAVQAAAPGGAVRMVGVAQGRVSFDSAAAIVKEVQLLSGFIYLPTEFSMAIRLLAEGAADVDALTTSILPIEAFDEALVSLRSPERTMKVLIKTSA